MSNICDRCGGVKTVFYSLELITGQRAALAQHQSGMIPLCLCPPLRSKHDGKLDADGIRTVRLRPGYGDSGTHFITLHNERVNAYFHLTPQQALSLLAWLKQEEATLEELAKEQEP